MGHTIVMIERKKKALYLVELAPLIMRLCSSSVLTIESMHDSKTAQGAADQKSEMSKAKALASDSGP